MRIIRWAALVGSLVLLVFTISAILNRRAEIGKDYGRQLDAASAFLITEVESTIDRAVAIASVAPADTDPDALDQFATPVDVCVVAADGEATCNGDDLSETEAYRLAERELADVDAVGATRAVAVVDADEECVLVLGGGDGHAVAIRLPVDALVDTEAAEIINDLQSDVEYAVTPTLDETIEPTDGTDTIDGKQVRTFVLDDPPEVGVVGVTVAVDPQITLISGGRKLDLVVLALGTVLLAVAAWTVIAERRRLERRATTDDLTGLVNRREFERQSEEAVLNADRFRTGLCIMLLDLDGFKEINDTRGHHFGDQVLAETAHRLRNAVRDTDVVGRWGGDEFVILLPGLEQTTAVRHSAERIAASLSDTPIVGDATVTGSIGAALYPRHGHTFDELIRAADGAMYGAKTTGVTHRLADALSGDDPGGAGEHYDGPERRRTPSTGEPVG